MHDALDFAARALCGTEALPATELEIYRWTGELVQFPIDATTGKPAALVHETLQDADWKALQPGAWGFHAGGLLCFAMPQHVAELTRGGRNIPASPQLKFVHVDVVLCVVAFPPTPHTHTATTFTVGSVVRRCGWWGCGCGCGCGVILHLMLERLNRHGDKKIVLPGTFER